MSSPLPLAPRCGLCNKQDELLRCAGCRVMLYCNRSHQQEHWATHKRLCSKAKKARVQCDNEEQKLRDFPGDMLTNPNPFENDVGHFWGVHETRPYMTARYAVVEAILKINTFDAVQEAYDHLRDMLRLCRGDNMGVREAVPALLIRLGRDQECYDFIKWYGTVGEEPDYDWGDMELGFLDVVDADVFESVDFLDHNSWPELGQLVAATLVKIRVLLDLQDLQNARELKSKVPQEVVDIAKNFLPRTNIISGNKDIMLSTDHSANIEKLEKQVDRLFKAVNKANKHFWPALLKPGKHLDSVPGAYSQGSVAEVTLKLQYTYNAWIETPGAVEIIKKKLAEV